MQCCILQCQPSCSGVDFAASCCFLSMQIGETLCSKESPVALPTIKVEEPTVSMTFKVRYFQHV